jgi:hypothetical protein
MGWFWGLSSSILFPISAEVNKTKMQLTSKVRSKAPRGVASGELTARSFFGGVQAG